MSFFDFEIKSAIAPNLAITATIPSRFPGACGSNRARLKSKLRSKITASTSTLRTKRLNSIRQEVFRKSSCDKRFYGLYWFKNSRIPSCACHAFHALPDKSFTKIENSAKLPSPKVT